MRYRKGKEWFEISEVMFVSEHAVFERANEHLDNNYRN